ncbi:MAG TPA: amidohydrolase family protein, partial [Acidimicrobiales bacterium]|nr:amidohydrolase family protein [Acidimicrobiales bacterium]
DGLLVTPGWVDIHSHYDGQALWDPVLETSAAHGVTTVVMGNCGVGFAPVRPEHRPWTIALMEGVEDIPGTVLEQGLDWRWQTFPEYLDALAAARHAIDVAAQVPHAALRVFAMGERGIDHAEVPTDDEVDAMGRLAAEAVVAGAVGFSSSRSRNHVASDGRLTPSFSAGDRELLGIARAMGRTGKGVVEINVDTRDLEGDMALLRRLCEASGRPVSMGLLQRPGQGDAYRQVLQAFEEAAGAGHTLLGQAAARPTGLLESLGGRVNPLAPSPTYREISACEPDALHKDEVKSRILAELSGEADMSARFPLAFELGDPPRYDRPRSESLAARAEAAGVEVKELVYDVVVGGGFVYVPVSNYLDGDLRAVHEMLVHPLTVPGLSDGGAHCTMIADFDYPTFLLGYWGRDAPEDLRLPVEWVVQQQCAATATLVGLHDRGTLEPGKRADVNLVDLAAVGATVPTLVHDLPAGGARLLSRGTGYVATMVAGEVTFEHGRYTGALAGGLARI